MRRTQFSERLDRGEASLPRRFRVVYVSQRHFNGDIRPIAKRGNFDDRDTSLTGGGESKCCVRSNRRWDEDGSTPTGSFEKAVQPSHRDRLWVESDEPGERADLGPDASDLSGDHFGGLQIFGSMGRNPAQEKWNNSKSRCSAACLGEQTWKARFIGCLPFQHSCRYMPATCLKLSPRRSQTICNLLAHLRGPPKRIVEQISEERDNVKECLPRTQWRQTCRRANPRS
jgi:hypothetical protein